MMLWKTNKCRHSWKNSDTRTITIEQSFINFEEFAAISGLSPSDPNAQNYANIFNQVYNLYGDSYTMYNAIDPLAINLRYVIEDEYKKYEKAQQLYDLEIEQLTGIYQEGKVFNIGDKTQDPENWDNHLAGRSLNVANGNLLDKIKELQSGLTPWDMMIKNIAKRVLINVRLDYVQK